MSDLIADTIVFFEIGDIVGMVVLHDEFEMDALDVSQMVSIYQPKTAHLFLHVWGLRHRDFKGDLASLTSKLLEFFLLMLMIYLRALLARLWQSLTLWAHHFSFGILLNFVSCFNDVPTFFTHGFEYFFSTCVALVMTFFLCILFISSHRSLRFIYSKRPLRDIQTQLGQNTCHQRVDPRRASMIDIFRQKLVLKPN